MLQFIQFLEEIERNNRSVVISGPELQRLIHRFGPKVRGIGLWNAIERSVEIPMSNILEAVNALDNRMLSEALEQLKTPENVTDFLTSSSRRGAVDPNPAKNAPRSVPTKSRAVPILGRSG